MSPNGATMRRPRTTQQSPQHCDDTLEAGHHTHPPTGMLPTTTAALPAGWSLESPSLWVGRLLVMTASAVYGTNFAVVKLLDEAMPVAVSAMLRFGLAALAVRGMVGWQEWGTTNPEGPAAQWAGLEVGAWYCLGYLAQALGLETSDASKSAFFNALAVIVVPLLDWIYRGKPLGWRQRTSVALAVLGVALLELSGDKMTAFGKGDLFCLCQAVTFGIGYWRLEDVSSRFPTQTGRVTVGQLTGVALGSTVFCLATDLRSLTKLSQWWTKGFIVGALLWTALVSTALALYLETVALKVVSAAELTVLMTSVSLFGSAFAYLTMGETMSNTGIIGGLLILSGCIFSSVGAPNEDHKKEKAAARPPKEAAETTSFWQSINMADLMVDKRKLF